MWFLMLILGLLHQTLALTADDCKSDGWSISPRPDGKAMCFKAFVTNRNLTFDEANTICSWNQAVAAPMQSKEDAEAIKKSVQEAFQSNVYLSGKQYQIYLGAYHTAFPAGSHGKFYWTIDKTEVDSGNYSNWDVGQPDTESPYKSQHEDCLMFRWLPHQEKNLAKWHDVACDCKLEDKCYEATGGVVCAKFAQQATVTKPEVTDPVTPSENEKCSDGSQKSAIVVAVDASWQTMEHTNNASLPAELNFVNELFKKAGECDKLQVVFYAGAIKGNEGLCRSSEFQKSEKRSVTDVFNSLYAYNEFYKFNPRDGLKFWFAGPDCSINTKTEKFFRKAQGFRNFLIHIGTALNNRAYPAVHLEYMSRTDKKFKKFKAKANVQVISIVDSNGDIERFRKWASDPIKDLFSASLSSWGLDNDLVDEVWQRMRDSPK